MNVGEAVIHNIRSTRPGYNLISNNCQTYVLQLLDAIKVSEIKEFGTTLAVYERLFGSGKVADLFEEEAGSNYDMPNGTMVMPPIGEQEVGIIGGTNGQVLTVPPLQTQEHLDAPPQQNSVLFAQQVMNANTTQLNVHEQMQRGIEDGEQQQDKEKNWSEKTTSFFRKLKK